MTRHLAIEPCHGKRLLLVSRKCGRLFLARCICGACELLSQSQFFCGKDSASQSHAKLQHEKQQSQLTERASVSVVVDQQERNMRLS